MCPPLPLLDLGLNQAINTIYPPSLLAAEIANPSYFNFSGSAASFPALLSTFSKLTALELGNFFFPSDNVTGVSPLSVGSQALTSLRCRGCQLTGTLPPAFSTLWPQLRVLDLAVNAISGVIPASVGPRGPNGLSPAWLRFRRPRRHPLELTTFPIPPVFKSPLHYSSAPSASPFCRCGRTA